MPYAVAHMLIPMILVDIFRDNILKIKKVKLPNKYILIAGLAGLLPDIDMLLSLFIFNDLSAHRTITHSIWLPLMFLMLFLGFYFLKRHRLSIIFLMCFTGVTVHILLDLLAYPSIALFYPFNKNLLGIIPETVISKTNLLILYSMLDAVLLFLWFVRIGFRKKIQDIV